MKTFRGFIFAFQFLLMLALALIELILLMALAPFRLFSNKGIDKINSVIDSKFNQIIHFFDL